jgi:hypothetical protein
LHYTINIIILVEKKLIQEDDQVIGIRIKALLRLFETVDNEEALKIVINGLDTYKKFIVCEAELQNNLSSKTLQVLIQSFLLVLCHTKNHEHLNRMVSPQLINN